VTGSDNDRYCSAENVRARAVEWRAGKLGMARVGHVNNESGLGDRQAGRAAVEAVVAGLAQAARSYADRPQT
jgi:predicted alpha/beta hydrolase family esterase